ncbi:MAG: hypothetical protein MPJ24_11525, partial [Pirellulaceae bacterium]|nr:hypothetical protein [Pirellulaceae bacterium]
MEESSKIRKMDDCYYFLLTLQKSLHEAPEDWGNPDLADFLDNFATTVENIDDYYQKHGITGVDS